MERNGTEHHIIFQLLRKGFNLGLGIPKLKFWGSRERYSMASGQRIQKRTEWNSSFRSIPFRVLVTTGKNKMCENLIAENFQTRKFSNVQCTCTLSLFLFASIANSFSIFDETPSFRQTYNLLQSRVSYRILCWGEHSFSEITVDHTHFYTNHTQCNLDRT